MTIIDSGTSNPSKEYVGRTDFGELLEGEILDSVYTPSSANTVFYNCTIDKVIIVDKEDKNEKIGSMYKGKLI